EEVADRVIDAGVKGIWNFAPYDLKGPEGIVVENIRLNDSLLTLSYFMKEIS
ncbi:MAG: redox-sensing transcriptional repressor Rex, partial [Peptoniphilus harei]|nr:redox-sensing transcriptional repressor Rex [Peptoniphilus harei]